MIAVVAFAAFLSLVLVVTAFSALLDNQRRAHARREDLLLNQLLHAVGKPWIEAPADAPVAKPERNLALVAQASPEQHAP